MSVLLKARRPRRGADPAFEMGTFLWLPLWSFVCAEATDILGADDEVGGFGQGHYISGEKARALAVRIDLLLRRRVVSAEAGRHQELARRERRKACPACRGRRVIRGPDTPKGCWERCWTCDGTGHPRAYPSFRTRWVREFRDFCEGSGGFWIR